MTELGTIIYNDGISQGTSQNASENARNLFINGVSFEIVCSSIKAISQEELQKIYDEVMTNKSS